MESHRDMSMMHGALCRDTKKHGIFVKCKGKDLKNLIRKP